GEQHKPAVATPDEASIGSPPAGATRSTPGGETVPGSELAAPSALWSPVRGARRGTEHGSEENPPESHAPLDAPRARYGSIRCLQTTHRSATPGPPPWPIRRCR